jgi:hypothetical protein
VPVTDGVLQPSRTVVAHVSGCAAKAKRLPPDRVAFAAQAQAR